MALGYWADPRARGRQHHHHRRHGRPRLDAPRHRARRPHHAWGRRAAAVQPRAARRAGVRRDLLRARCVLVRHRQRAGVRDHRPRQPGAPAAREVADRRGHRRSSATSRSAGAWPQRWRGSIGVALVYLLAWRLLRPVADGRGGDRRGRRRLRPAGDRPPPPRPLAGRDARRVHRPVRHRRRDGRRPRPGPGAGARAHLVVEADPRTAVAAAWPAICLGAAAATKWSGAYVAPAIIGLVIAWEIVERRRAEPDAGIGAWLRGAIRREALPTRRPARARPGRRLRAQLHRSDARRRDRAALGGRIGVARHLGAPARDARLPHPARREPSVSIATVVVAPAQAAGGVLVQRRGRHVPPHPCAGQPGRRGGRGSSRSAAWRSRGGGPAGGSRAARSRSSWPRPSAPTSRGWSCPAIGARPSSGTSCRPCPSCAWRSGASPPGHGRGSPGGWSAGSTEPWSSRASRSGCP